MARHTETAEGSPEPAKKAKIAGRARGKGAGAKAKAFRLADVPVDVFCEIATHVLPIDLLHLARTSKAFRRVLMRRGARHVWQAAMKNETDIPVPPMPEDMAEPAWVHLLFSHFCHSCLKKGPHTPFWELRLRLCASCRKEDECEPVMGMHHALADHFDYDFEGDIGAVGVFEVMPVLSKGEAQKHTLMFGMHNYRNSDYKALERTLRRASIKERTEIVLARQETMKARREHAFRYLASWDLKQSHARSYDKHQIKLTRRKAIVAKLRELGYGPEFDTMTAQERGEFGDMREVAQFRPLTDRIWLSIKDACIEFMEEVRATHEDVGAVPGVRGWDGSDVIDYDYWKTQARSSFDPLSDYESILS
ncbi:hypothetical protein PHLGIDRAFT_126440 [Phlebiopsis gigantea 11061_1 CR5-6]|uniref:F-box domain-containing protein n=1 Tax=Phlebiopsis gigantea (strain 11061_1 CR5-6) TaxID=745531 RepID=A0A0C3PQE6_PHLG1|nr:hypothetical protein PHLGIDRAFT_126440 [Phlebiopsis gigantea 11061_1 CR5-6]